MKVTIDTKEDSHDDIKKILYILTNILQQKGNQHVSSNRNYSASSNLNNISDVNLNSVDASVDTTNMMNMFENSSSNETNQESSVPMTMFNSNESVPEKAPDFTSFLNLTNKEEKKNNPKIEYF